MNLYVLYVCCMYAHSGKESNISIEAKLDELIDFIKTIPDRCFSTKDINDQFRRDGKFPYTLNMLICQLYKDDIISKTGSGHQGEVAVDNYILTVKGELFEGYVKQKEKEYYANLRVKVESYAVIVGGIIAVVYLFAKVFLWYFGY